MNLTIFWRAWKLDFWPLLGVYPPGLALADYWSHLLGVYPLGLGFTPLALLWIYPFDWAKPGFTPLTTRGLPLKWAPPHVSRQRGKPSNRFNNEFDHFWRAWKLDFWPLLGVYPPGLALADYWSHLLGIYPPWPGVYP